LKLFQREQRSLFGEILDWMLTPLLLLWPVGLALTWLVAQGIANKPFDRALIYNAHALAQLVTVQRGRPQFNLPQSASEILRADDSDSVYYQVLGPRGEWLSGERDLPPPPEEETPQPGDVRLRDAELRGVDIRVAYIWVRVPVEGNPLALVQVAETREKRSVLATEIIKGVMVPQFVLLPLAVLLVWLALARGIKPLNQLEERIRARSPDDLSPLDHKTVPLEVAPLVDSVNDLLTRLNDSLATQKRFLADAAHQLKTPLAGLRMQADLAQREGTSTEELKQSLQTDRALQHPRHAHRQPVAGPGPGRGQRRADDPAALRPGTPDHGRGARLGAPRHGQAHRPGLRRCRARRPRRVAGRQPHPAQGTGAQPGGQRHQLHPLLGRQTRRGDRARAGRHLRPRAAAAGGGHRPRRARV
jgi:two-component system sensor histidine kinase TctE